MENVSYLFAAYSATWVLLCGYLYLLWRKQNRIEQGLQSLTEQKERLET